MSAPAPLLAPDLVAGLKRLKPSVPWSTEENAVEPVSFTLGAVAAALVAEAMNKTAEQAVEGGAGVLRRLVAWLRKRFLLTGNSKGPLLWPLPSSPVLRDEIP